MRRVGLPDLIRSSCQQRLADVDRAVPRIVFQVKDGEGNDVPAVKLTIDGQPREERPGAAIALDPGQHVFAFEGPGMPLVQKTLVLVEGVRDRSETLVLGRVAPATGTAATVEAVPSTAGGAQKILAARGRWRGHRRARGRHRLRSDRKLQLECRAEGPVFLRAAKRRERGNGLHGRLRDRWRRHRRRRGPLVHRTERLGRVFESLPRSRAMRVRGRRHRRTARWVLKRKRESGLSGSKQDLLARRWSAPGQRRQQVHLIAVGQHPPQVLVHGGAIAVEHERRGRSRASGHARSHPALRRGVPPGRTARRAAATARAVAVAAADRGMRGSGAHRRTAGRSRGSP